MFHFPLAVNIFGWSRSFSPKNKEIKIKHRFFRRTLCTTKGRRGIYILNPEICLLLHSEAKVLYLRNLLQVLSSWLLIKHWHKSNSQNRSHQSHFPFLCKNSQFSSKPSNLVSLGWKLVHGFSTANPQHTSDWNPATLMKTFPFPCPKNSCPDHHSSVSALAPPARFFNLPVSPLLVCRLVLGWAAPPPWFYWSTQSSRFWCSNSPWWQKS